MCDESLAGETVAKPNRYLVTFNWSQPHRILELAARLPISMVKDPTTS